MKRIFTTFNQKWPEYLLEILVLIIGIYGAFEVDNWKEQRQIREKEQVILANLKTEVEANIAELDAIYKNHQLNLNGAIELLKLFGTDVSAIPVAKLDTLLVKVETVWTFEARDGTIKSVISSGNLDYLQNDSLKAMITSFEGEVINATQEITHMHRLLHDRFWPLVDGKLNSSNRLIVFGYDQIPPGSYASDYNWFFANREAEDIISNIASWQYEAIEEEQLFRGYLVKFLELINHSQATGNKSKSL